MTHCKTPEHRATFFKYKHIKQQATCFTCGESEYSKIEFHHICYDDGHGKKITGKFLEVSKMVRMNFEWQDIADEIDKCIPLCKPCHTEYHRKLGQ
jgi:hypothetical protein